MIQYKIYNNDRIRKFYGFPTLKDPYVLENTLLRIINLYLFSIGFQQVQDVKDPSLNNLFFTYITTSNYKSWGELPLPYIYQDMIRHIQDKNTTNNFICTLESIYIDNSSSYPTYSSKNGYIPYEIITAYITENYLNSYMYMNNNNRGILVVYIPDANGLMTYIISVGFDPINQAKWFCTSTKANDINALPFNRYLSLKGIVNTKMGIDRVSMNPNLDKNIYLECSDIKKNEKIENCIEEVNKVNISELKRKSEYDVNTKYDNFPINYSYLDYYDKAIPAMFSHYMDKNGNIIVLNKFNQYGDDYRIDYRFYKHQNSMIEVNEKRKGERL